jgi:hypothetical protein
MGALLTDPTPKVHSVFTIVGQNNPMSPAPSLKMKNLRASNRYAVRALLQYRAAIPSLESVWKSGYTHVMSAGGILIYPSDVVPVGATLEVAIDWPGLYHGKPMVRLFVIGTVARVDGRGTALRILSHEFRDVRPILTRRRSAERNLVVAW